MNTREYKILHRFHTKMTKKLAHAYTSLSKAEANETLPAGLYYAQVARAKKQIESLVAQLKQYEAEHPEL